jgi:hypothetical protein
MKEAKKFLRSRFREVLSRYNKNVIDMSRETMIPYSYLSKIFRQEIHVGAYTRRRVQEYFENLEGREIPFNEMWEER